MMILSIRTVFSLAALLPFVLAAPNQTPAFDIKTFKKSEVIERDVAIVGGGSAGTYSAISLKDKGKSIIVIEKTARLGGHTHTYRDPATGVQFDYGVIVFHNTTVVTNYFKRFDVPLTRSTFGAGRTEEYDFKTGQMLNLAHPSQEQVGAAFAAYAQQLAKYPRLNDGMFLPEPVPAELYMPFGEFAKKYGIQAAVPSIYNFAQGIGDILTVPTVEVIRLAGITILDSIANGFLTTERHNNSEIYAKAQAELLSSFSLFLNSEVLLAKRNYGKTSTDIFVRTPSGMKCIRAKKLLIAIPPKLDFLAPFIPSKEEIGVFSKLINTGYYAGVLSNDGIPGDLNINNQDPKAGYNIPLMPASYALTSTGVSGLHAFYYGAPRSPLSFPLSDAAVKSNITTQIQRLQKANPASFTQTKPEFAEYSSHAPFFVQARPEDTKKGFYERMYALQGLKNTYWTGAAWRAEDSSNIWRFTEEEVLPKLLAGLESKAQH